MKFTLNGAALEVSADGERRLIDLLREDLGLTGSKESCGTGECGSCTVLLDGRPRLACLTLAAQVEGRVLTTVEGLTAADGSPHPLQTALTEAGAVQCGFCTPGMVMSGVALLADNADPSEREIREALSNNICRCTGYQKIVDGVRACAENQRRQNHGAGEGG